MKHLRRIALLVLMLGLVTGATGCLIQRRIHQVIAHDTHNSLKVQTQDSYWAFLSAWVEFNVWNCYRTESTFRCTQVQHERALQGFQPKSDALPGTAPANAPAAAGVAPGAAPAPPPVAPVAPPPTAAPPTAAPPTAAPPAAQACTKDIDCPDPQICGAGQCTNP